MYVPRLSVSVDFYLKNCIPRISLDQAQAPAPLAKRPRVAAPLAQTSLGFPDPTRLLYDLGILSPSASAFPGSALVPGF
jgi:hypothetical protein